MINFNEPIYINKGLNYISDAIFINKRLNGDGVFTGKCKKWMESKFSSNEVLLTTSCTHALEMGAILCDIKAGDEVIMPSYTFVSTANAFVLHGARIKFVDIRPDTMNIDEKLIENAITEKTKAIIPVHYAGVACEMDTIQEIAKKYKLLVIEDAAQGVMGRYQDKYLGSIGDIGCYSFHETKNYTMGEGGAILVNNLNFKERAEIIREKGTNRTQFFKGEIDKYSWVDKGSSYLPSEMNAAYLYAQLEIAEEIKENRLATWDFYYQGLKILEENGFIELPFIPENCTHNAHMFYVKAKDLDERGNLIHYLKSNGIGAVFHYVPLHSSIAGLKYGEFIGEDHYTTKESERLVRLPLYYGINKQDVEYIVKKVCDFYIRH
ncbi:MAG: TDP-4-oxo-6-deoxy-D-glucose aminotransferase [Anaerocolumna sp.]|nr:TDP-4-oxo-6-deoxy-D-glucose aminotransferase [Anaerocolumna sp.]